MRSILVSLKDAILRAVVAPAGRKRIPSYRPLGKAVTPYHYMQPIPVPVEQPKGR